MLPKFPECRRVCAPLKFRLKITLPTERIENSKHSKHSGAKISAQSLFFQQKMSTYRELKGDFNVVLLHWYYASSMLLQVARVTSS